MAPTYVTDNLVMFRIAINNSRELAVLVRNGTKFQESRLKRYCNWLLAQRCCRCSPERTLHIHIRVCECAQYMLYSSHRPRSLVASLLFSAKRCKRSQMQKRNHHGHSSIQTQYGWSFVLRERHICMGQSSNARLRSQVTSYLHGPSF